MSRILDNEIMGDERAVNLRPQYSRRYGRRMGKGPAENAIEAAKLRDEALMSLWPPGLGKKPPWPLSFANELRASISNRLLVLSLKRRVTWYHNDLEPRALSSHRWVCLCQSEEVLQRHGRFYIDIMIGAGESSRVPPFTLVGRRLELVLSIPLARSLWDYRTHGITMKQDDLTRLSGLRRDL